jgi:hypothetical protein
MMRIVQSIAIGAIGSEYFDDRVGKRYAAFEGIVYDLGQIAACLDRIEAMLTGVVARDDLALAAYTWLAVMMYSRCFDNSAEGRQGALGDKATRLFSGDEAQLHAGLLDVRNERFAHAGPDARHRCILAMFERDGARWLAPGFEIETPTGMFDDEQVALMQRIVRKLLEYSATERDAVRRSLEDRIQSPEIATPIHERIAITGRQVTPEAQALAILAKIAGRMDRG